MKSKSTANNRLNPSGDWQNRVGKNSSFAEAVYHAWLGLVCVWSTSLNFKLIVVSSIVAIAVLLSLHIDLIYISVTGLAGSMAVASSLVVNAFARLIKLAHGARS